MYHFVIDVTLAHRATLAHEQHPEQVYRLEAGEWDDVVIDYLRNCL